MFSRVAFKAQRFWRVNYNLFVGADYKGSNGATFWDFITPFSWRDNKKYEDHNISELRRYLIQWYPTGKSNSFRDVWIIKPTN
jgi:hypothetical protein